MTKVVRLDRADMQVNEILSDAIDANYETIIVVGMKDDKIYIAGDGVMDRLKVMGACFAAAMDRWDID